MPWRLPSIRTTPPDRKKINSMLSNRPEGRHITWRWGVPMRCRGCFQPKPTSYRPARGGAEFCSPIHTRPDWCPRALAILILPRQVVWLAGRPWVLPPSRTHPGNLHCSICRAPTVNPTGVSPHIPRPRPPGLTNSHGDPKPKCPPTAPTPAARGFLSLRHVPRFPWQCRAVSPESAPPARRAASGAEMLLAQRWPGGEAGLARGTLGNGVLGLFRYGPCASGKQSRERAATGKCSRSHTLLARKSLVFCIRWPARKSLCCMPEFLRGALRKREGAKRAARVASPESGAV